MHTLGGLTIYLPQKRREKKKKLLLITLARSVPVCGYKVTFVFTLGALKYIYLKVKVDRDLN